MTEVGQLELPIKVDDKDLMRLQKQLGKTAVAAAATDKSMGKLDRGMAKADRSGFKLTRSLKGTVSALKYLRFTAIPAAIAVAGVAASGIGLAAAAAYSGDKVKSLKEKIKALAPPGTEAMEVLDKIKEKAYNAGVDLDATVNLYAGVAATAKELNATNEEVLEFTDIISKQMALTNTSTVDAKNSLRQLSQSMASGVVRAEEWNSVVENTPALAKLIADSMGVSLGTMRNMVIEGKVLSKDVFEGILSQSGRVNKAFEEKADTLGQGVQRLQMKATEMFAALDESVGISASFTTFMNEASVLAGEIAILIKTDWAEGLGEAKQMLAGMVDGLIEFMAQVAGGDKLANKFRELPELQEELITYTNHLAELEAGLTKEKEKQISGTKRVGIYAITEAKQREIQAKNIKSWEDKITAAKEIQTQLYELIAKRQQEARDAAKAAADAEQQAIEDAKQRKKVDEAVAELPDLAAAWEEKAAQERQAMEAHAAWVRSFEEKEAQDRLMSKKVTYGLELQALQESEENKQRYKVEAAIADMEKDAERLAEKQGIELQALQEGYENQNNMKKTAWERELTEEQKVAQKKLQISANVFDGLAALSDEATRYDAKSFELTKALRKAQAVIDTYAGAAKAIATYPGPWGIAAAAAVVAKGMVYVSQINAQQPVKRAKGGLATAGKLYEVGEEGPELFSSGGRQFMMPGRAGRVSPIQQTRGSGGGRSNMQVTVNNNAPGVQIQTKEDGQGGLTVEVMEQMMVENIQEGGTLADAISQQFSTLSR